MVANAKPYRKNIMNKQRRLNEFFKIIPQIECPKGCTKCCGPVEVSTTEAVRMGMGDRNCTHYDKNFDCEFKVNGGCSIYKNRPFVCRFFGNGKKGTPMACGYREEAGLPEGTLSGEDQMRLMEVYFQLMLSDGITEVNEDQLFALHTHDHMNGFRSSELKDMLPPVVCERYEKWKEKKLNENTTID